MKLRPVFSDTWLSNIFAKPTKKGIKQVLVFVFHIHGTETVSD